MTGGHTACTQSRTHDQFQSLHKGRWLQDGRPLPTPNLQLRFRVRFIIQWFQSLTVHWNQYHLGRESDWRIQCLPKWSLKICVCLNSYMADTYIACSSFQAMGQVTYKLTYCTTSRRELKFWVEWIFVVILHSVFSEKCTRLPRQGPIVFLCWGKHFSSK